MDVLSIDTNGFEYEILSGGRQRLPQVRQLWVELIACDPRCADLFELLMRDHTVFDMVWWGLRKGLDQTDIDFSVGSFWGRSNRTKHRPLEAAAYCRHMCSVREAHFYWLQTDLVAVRKDLVTRGRHRRMQSFTPGDITRSK